MPINSIGGFGGGNVFNTLRKTQNAKSQNLAALASGKRINSAKDDPAGLALVKKLEASVRSLKAADQGINLASASLQTADGALSGTSENLQRLRELAVQSANGTLSDSDREALNQEFTQVKAEIDRVSSSTKFNGTNLLDGSFNTSVIVGSDASAQKEVSTGDASANALGVSDSNISSHSSAQNALDAIDSAIDRVSSLRSQIGAQQSGLEFAQNANAVARENQLAAKSQAEDADLAQLTSEQSENSTKEQLALGVLRAQLDGKKKFAQSFFDKK